MLASLVLAAAIDPAAVTCKEYNLASHDRMVEISDAIHMTLQSDPRFGKMSEDDFLSAIYVACAKDKRAKIVDVLKGGS